MHEHTHTCTYAHLSSEPYSKLPLIKLNVNGVRLPFMVDSGATYSVLRHKDMTPTPRLSGRSVISVAANGKQNLEKFTVPLKCASQCGSFSHSFLLSNLCPVNLCGRNLMCKVGITLVSGPEGLEVIQRHTDSDTDFQSESDYTHTLVKYGTGIPGYEYQWRVPNLPTARLWTEYCDHCTKMGNSISRPETLYCTFHYSSEGPDLTYEKQFFRLPSDKPTTTHV